MEKELQAFLWSGLGLFAVKEIYRMIQERGQKADKDLQSQAVGAAEMKVRLESLKDDINQMRDRIRDVEKSTLAQWSVLDPEGKRRSGNGQ